MRREMIVTFSSQQDTDKRNGNKKNNSKTDHDVIITSLCRFTLFLVFLTFDTLRVQFQIISFLLQIYN